MSRITPFILISAVAAFLFAAVAGAQTDVTFNANLAGISEVPPVNTGAQGRLVLQLTRDGNFLHFSLMVSNIDGIRSASLNLGRPIENGPDIAILYKGPKIVGSSMASWL